jgi:outer membrane protein assembly factor BamD
MALLTLPSCKYQKVLKSSDSELKYEKAKAYYDKKDYTKALTLIEQLIPIFRGTERGEEVSYLQAYCNYYLRDYILAGHYFRKFNSQFQNSKFAEESAFMSAYCYYLDAPKPELDQETTHKAISEFAIYMSRYPQSERLKECNEYMEELRTRLEEKSYNTAMLYYRVGKYKAAVVTIRNSLKEFPDSEYREDLMFYMVKANYLYAIGSVYGKTTERLKDTLKDYKAFAKAFPESKYKKEAVRIYEDINRKLGMLN